MKFQSVRLFPKNRGANHYISSGIARRCDLVIFSDVNDPVIEVRGNRSGSPSTVFLSLRNPFEAICFLYNKVLPQLDKPIILYSGSEDITLPDQTDARWRDWTAEEKQIIQSIMDHPMVRYWFAENCTKMIPGKLFPLPTGLVFPDSMDRAVKTHCPENWDTRPIRAFCGHRTRAGSQWDLRRDVSRMIDNMGQQHIFNSEVTRTEEEFIELLQTTAFVLCVEGGGIDPSPKAWLAISLGCIPILRKSSVMASYEKLPVAWVDDWTPEQLSVKRLSFWKKTLSWWFLTAVGRDAVSRRLAQDYWFFDNPDSVSKRFGRSKTNLKRPSL